MTIVQAPQRPTSPDAGTSICFSGSANQKAYESSAVAAYGPGANPISAFAWSLRRFSSSGNPIAIIGKGKATAGNLSWMLSYLSTGLIRVDMSILGSITVSTTTNGGVDTANYHHIGFTYDPNTTTCLIYVDGVVVKTNNAAPASLLPGASANMPVTIGGVSAAIGTIGFPGQAMIQEAFVTTQVLSAATIKAIMALGARTALPMAGTTSSIWLVGEDVGINAGSGTGTATDFGNAGSNLTITACNIDWYGRSRGRLPRGLPTLRMNAPTRTPGVYNAWNLVAQNGDIASQLWNAQNGAQISAGSNMIAYATYDYVGNGGPGNGIQPDGKTDMANWTPSASPGGTNALIVGYDNEVWANTPTFEQGNVAICQQFARDAKARGYQFMMIPDTLNFAIPNAGAIAGITLANGQPACDHFMIQAQRYLSTVDTFCQTIFPILKAIYTASPTTKIWIQTQNAVTNSTKIADHVDIYQAICNAHNYLQSLGSPGLYGWGFFTADAQLPIFASIQAMARPSARTPVTTLVGTATSATTTTLVDNTKTWTVNQWTGLTVSLLTGTGAGQRALIVSNTATTLTIKNVWTTPNRTPVSATWPVTPDATTRYFIGREPRV